MANIAIGQRQTIPLSASIPVGNDLVTDDLLYYPEIAKILAFSPISASSHIRMITGRVFFGHRVDTIFSKAHCSIAVISST